MDDDLVNFTCRGTFGGVSADVGDFSFNLQQDCGCIQSVSTQLNRLGCFFGVCLGACKELQNKIRLSFNPLQFVLSRPHFK